VHRPARAVNIQILKHLIFCSKGAFHIGHKLL
jgi:hypothetical protein